MLLPMTTLAQEIRNAVLRLTSRRVWNLAVEVLPEKVVLRGDTNSYYNKQMAQEGARQVLPEVPLVNAIQVAA